MSTELNNLVDRLQNAADKLKSVYTSGIMREYLSARDAFVQALQRKEEDVIQAVVFQDNLKQAPNFRESYGYFISTLIIKIGFLSDDSIDPANDIRDLYTIVQDQKNLTGLPVLRKHTQVLAEELAGLLSLSDALPPENRAIAERMSSASDDFLSTLKEIENICLELVQSLPPSRTAKLPAPDRPKP